MGDRHLGNILSSISTAKDNIEFADLVLVCGGREFHVHRIIVCTRSPVLNAMCRAKQPDSTDGRVNVDVTDAHTLARLLSYLYTGDYNDQGASADDRVAAETSTDRRRRGTEAADYNKAMLANARVYIAADHYQIANLLEFARDKFQAAAQHPSAGGLTPVVAFLYGGDADAAAAAPLRPVLCQAIVTKIEALMASEEADRFFRVADAPGLMADLFPALLAHFRFCMNEAAAQILVQKSEVEHEVARLQAQNRHLAAEVTKANGAKKTVAGELKGLKDKIEKAKVCRGCQKPSNVILDGGLRCVCRCKY